jgi:hypothetical protein
LEATVGPEKQAVKKQMKYYRFTTEGDNNQLEVAVPKIK